MRILIADDEPKIRNGLKNFILKSFEIPTEVECAKDGMEALEICKKMNPDIILTDIRMPKLNGLDFISRVSEINKDVVVIIISGHDDFKYAQEAIRLSAYDFLLKPINLDETKEVILKAYKGIIGKRELTSINKLVKQGIDNCLDPIHNNVFQKIINGEMDEDLYMSYCSLMNESLPYGKTTLIGIKILMGPGIHEQVENLKKAKDKIDLMKDVYDVNRLVSYIYKDEILLVVTDRLEDSKYNLIHKEVIAYSYDMLQCDLLMEHVNMNDLISEYNEALKILQKKLHEKIKLSDIVYKAKKIIEEDYSDEELSLNDLSARLSVNSSYLSRSFHREVGSSFGQYLTNTRLNSAVKIIRSSEKDIKIYEISSKVGYSSQHYFCRVFKKKFGLSPLAYINDVKKKVNENEQT